MYVLYVQLMPYYVAYFIMLPGWCFPNQATMVPHNIDTRLEKMLDMYCLIDDPDCPTAGRHHEMGRAEINKSEDAVQRTIAICSLTSPFLLLDKDHLYSLTSGARTAAELELFDIICAETAGKTATKRFIQERFVNV